MMSFFMRTNYASSTDPPAVNFFGGCSTVSGAELTSNTALTAQEKTELYLTGRKACPAGEIESSYVSEETLTKVKSIIMDDWSCVPEEDWSASLCPNFLARTLAW